MRVRYKKDILAELKTAGYSTYRLRKQRLLSEKVIQAIRKGEYVAPRNIAKAAILLDCRPADLVEYVPDPADYRWIAARERTPSTDYY